MRRALLSLLTLLLPLSASAAEAQTATPPAVTEPAKQKPIDLLLSVGFGFHRFLATGLADENGGSAQSFDGSYLQAMAGIRLYEQGILGVDWSHTGGTSALRTEAAQLKLSMDADTFSLVGGAQFGRETVRLSLLVLGGMANGRFTRTLEADRDVSTAGSTVQRLALGAQAGLDVAPTQWLLIGARARLMSTLSPFENEADLGGLFLGISASFLL